MFGPYSGGPDWFHELDRALSCLYQWRAKSLAAAVDFKRKELKWNTTYLSHYPGITTSTLYGFFSAL